MAIVFVNLRSLAKYPENSEVKLRRRLKKRRLSLDCSIFYGDIVAYGGEKG